MKTGIIRYPGSNCDYDTLKYFDNSFFIWHTETDLPNIDLLIIPGGFAFGDRIYNKATDNYIISPGEMALKSPVTELILKAVERKIPILGICNGFQILIKLKLLPGDLILNDCKQFICKKVKCNYNFDNINGDTELYVANSYGKYIECTKNYKVFLRYENNCMNEIGSFNNIAGISNENNTIFGMMPHPERNNIDFKDILNTILFKNSQHLYFDSQINNLLLSEHISYKSTRRFLRKLPTKAPWVIQGPGENAGIVDIGDDYCIAIRIESHNHPTFINPFEGAATGVGGILRDIFTMGARPIGILDFLRFGTDEHSENLLHNTIKGISYYGNCIGVPNIGGDLYKHASYNKNPLVNIGCLGIVKKNNIIYGKAKTENLLLIYVGSKTGEEGINGAAMASKSFENNIEDLKDNVQKGDPYLEKLLLEACCELSELNLVEGMQDMGAGGLLCASYEVVNRGRDVTKNNLGCTINIDNVPIKYNMNSCDILISESQERMLIVSTEQNKQSIFDIFEKWDLEYSVIGKTTLDGNYSVYDNNNLLYSKSMNCFDTSDEIWIPETQTNTNNISKKTSNISTKIKDMSLWNTYDSTVGSRTIKGPDKSGSYSILDIYEIGKKIILTWDENISVCLDNIKEFNAKPLCIVNCLNFGHPKSSITDFSETIDMMINECTINNIPIVGGNVSLYNSTNNTDIRPTPIFLLLALL